MSGNRIKCPNCGKDVEISEAFKHQIEEQIVSEISKKHEKELQKVAEKTKKNLEEKIKKQSEMELSDLKNQLKEQSQKLDQMRDQELKLREEKRKIEEEKKDLKLAVERQIDKKSKEIEKKAQEKAHEEFRLKEKEKEKTIEDLKKALEEARRKAQQGSQQTQGEVLEIDFEQKLIQEFPNDEITPVEKGSRGADVRQVVKSPKGIHCGTILWETKRTKTWSDKWIAKLKDDLRAEKANIPVIVSISLPKDMKNEMGLRNGVWIVSYGLSITLARLLRKNLLDVGYQKALSTHRGKKADHLYEYITSHEFRHQVEAIVEVYKTTKDQIEKERRAYERLWKTREKQAERIVMSTANIVGSIQGVVGQASLPVKGLDLLELESGGD